MMHWWNKYLHSHCSWIRSVTLLQPFHAESGAAGRSMLGPITGCLPKENTTWRKYWEDLSMAFQLWYNQRVCESLLHTDNNNKRIALDVRFPDLISATSSCIINSCKLHSRRTSCLYPDGNKCDRVVKTYNLFAEFDLFMTESRETYSNRLWCS